MNDDREGLPGLPIAIDCAPEDLEKLKDIPLRAQQIGALLSVGFTCPEIDKAFSLPEKTAQRYKLHYFNRNNVVITPRTRDSIIAAFLRHKSLQLVNGITHDKITKAGVGELAKSATMLMQRAESLEGTSQAIDIGAQISDALSKLSQPVKPKQVT